MLVNYLFGSFGSISIGIFEWLFCLRSEYDGEGYLCLMLILIL